MTDMIAASLEIATDYIAVRYGKAAPAALLARCSTWLDAVDAEDAAIRDSRFCVSQKLDLLDKAKDRVRAVALNCQEIAQKRAAA